MIKANGRVIAVAQIKNRVAEIYGRGIYKGKIKVEYEGVRGNPLDYYKEHGLSHYAVQLEDGNYVYGCEAWWNSERVVNLRLKNCREIRIVTIKEMVERKNGSTNTAKVCI